MRSLTIKTILTAVMVSIVVVNVRSDDIVARIYFKGALRSGLAKQSLRGSFTGHGEYGFLNLDVDLSGTILSQPNTRLPERVLYGKYPVEIDLRVGRSGVSVSDSFKKNIEVRRRSIYVNNIGTIRLYRPVDPTRSGMQRVRGKGTFRYNF